MNIQKLKKNRQLLIIIVIVIAISIILVSSMLQIPGVQINVEERQSDFTVELNSPLETTAILIQSYNDSFSSVILSVTITPGNDTLFYAEMFLNVESIRYNEFTGSLPLTLEKTIQVQADLTTKSPGNTWTDHYDVTIIIRDIDNLESIVSVRFSVQYTWDPDYSFDVVEVEETTTVPVYTAPTTTSESEIPIDTLLVIGGFITMSAIAVIIYRNRRIK